MAKLRADASYKIMVVDDDLVTLELAMRILSAKGHAPTPVNDGETALFMVSPLDPDVILLDVTMPGMDGFQLLHALKDDPKTSAIPVVMMSVTTDTESVKTAFKLGSVDYVAKPLVAADLIARVDRAVAKAQAHQPKGRSVAWG